MPMEHRNQGNVNNLKRWRNECILFNTLGVILDWSLLAQHSQARRYSSELSTIWMFLVTLEHSRHTAASSHCDLSS